jgi:putative spermidine/putrescine transport system permease protein
MTVASPAHETSSPAPGNRLLEIWHASEQHAITLLLLLPALASFFGLFAYPILITLVQSFRPEGQEVGFTLDNYLNFLGDPHGHDVIVLTFVLAIGTTFFSLLFSLPLSLILREKVRGDRFFRLLVMIPLMIPGLIGALGLLLFFGSRGWFNLAIQVLPFIQEPLTINYTLQGLMLFYVWLYFPYTCLTTLSALEGLDRAVEEAGAVAGATPRQVLWHLILPQILPGILAGSVLTFMTAFGAFSIPLITGGNYRPLSVEIYKEISSFIPAHWSAASAMAIVMGILQVTALTLYMRLLRQRQVR